MVYRYKKPYRVKKKKSILRSRFFWPGILILSAIGGVSYFLFFSGIFQIKKIIITGDQIVSEENIKAFVSQRNIFLVDTKKMEKDILGNFVQITKVEITRALPDTLNIQVVKRLSVALWCEDKNCFWVDNEAVIFGEVLIPSEAEGLVKIFGAKELLNKEKISQILEIQEKFKDGVRVTTTQALIVSKERLNIKISEGWEIYFNTGGNLDWQLQELSLVLEKQITPAKRRSLEYVDLRFSRVYYK